MHATANLFLVLHPILITHKTTSSTILMALLNKAILLYCFSVFAGKCYSRHLALFEFTVPYFLLSSQKIKKENIFYWYWFNHLTVILFEYGISATICKLLNYHISFIPYVSMFLHWTLQRTVPSLTCAWGILFLPHSQSTYHLDFLRRMFYCSCTVLLCMNNMFVEVV